MFQYVQGRRIRDFFECLKYVNAEPPTPSNVVSDHMNFLRYYIINMETFRTRSAPVRINARLSHARQQPVDELDDNLLSSSDDNVDDMEETYEFHPATHPIQKKKKRRRKRAVWPGDTLCL